MIDCPQNNCVRIRKKVFLHYILQSVIHIFQVGCGCVLVGDINNDALAWEYQFSSETLIVNRNGNSRTSGNSHYSIRLKF